MNRPVFVFAYANDRLDERNYLRDLPNEQRAIKQGLQEASIAKRCNITSCPNATIEELLIACQTGGRRLALFHFGGHSDGRTLLFETLTGGAASVRGKSLAQFLGGLRALKLVVLNGCGTGEQVDSLLEAGIPAVVATSTVVRDDVARDFAEYFYRAIGEGSTIRSAFEQASRAVQLKAEAMADSVTPTGLPILGRLVRDIVQGGPYFAASSSDLNIDSLWKLHGETAAVDVSLIATTSKAPLIAVSATILLALVAFVLFILFRGPTELELMEADCARNIARQCYRAGVVYWDRNEDSQAVQHFHFGCLKGSALSCAYLGTAYQKGRGRKQDMEAAVTLYKRACDEKEWYGCASLGQCLAAGEGVPRDIPRARQLFAASCYQGEPLGCDFAQFDWETWAKKHPQ